VTPTEPGFKRIRVAPQRCGLNRAAGTVCTPHGLVSVEWHALADQFRLVITTPVEIPVVVVAPNGEQREFSSRHFEETFALSPV